MTLLLNEASSINKFCNHTSPITPPEKEKMSSSRSAPFALLPLLLCVLPLKSNGFAPGPTFTVQKQHADLVTVASTSASTADADADVSTTTSPGTISAAAILRAKSKVLSVAERCNENSNAGIFLINPKDRKELKKAVSELEALIDRDPTESDQHTMIGEWKLLCTTNAGSTFDDRLSFDDNIEEEEESIESGVSPGKVKATRGTNTGPFGLPNPFELFSSTTGVKTPSFLPSAEKVEKISERVLDRVRKSVEVTQSIRAKTDGDEDSDNAILDRVDNIIEFVPLDLAALHLEELMQGNISEEEEGRKEMKAFNQGAAAFLGNVTSFISKLPSTLNVLNVTKTKVTLLHHATIESTVPVLKTKIGLEKVLLNVAGKSQYLETDGKDILDLDVVPSIPGLKDLLSARTFDTTYVDEDIRISRSTVGFLEELHVFERKGRTERGMRGSMMEAETFEELDDGETPDLDSLGP